MRVLTSVLISAAAMFAPALASADPVQAQSAPVAQTAPAPSAAAQAAQTVVVTAPPANNPAEIECRMSPPPIGSRLGGARECHTQREWDRRQRESQSILGGSQLRGLQGMPSNPLGGGGN